MRQNPVTSRIQIGGRQMPSWFSSSLVQNRTNPAMPPPPPPGPPPQDESEYEEIDHLPRYTNTNTRNSTTTATKRSCSLCGNPNPVVRCEMCNNQIFCGSCNDMYHRHPKRHNHLRKLLEPPFEHRPPLPPKGPSSDAPVPPPRGIKKMGIRSATNSPTSTRKMFFDPFGSLRRNSTMVQRPLPAPPKPAPPLPPKSMTVNQQFQRQMSTSQRNIPLTILEMTNQGQSQGQRRNTFVNDQSMNSPWMGDRQFLPGAQPNNNGNIDVMRGRSQSISTSQLDRFNSSASNLSHIATLQRKPKRPIICGPPRPPPIPPREYPQPQQLPQHHYSASAFNLNQLPMDDSQFDPWMQPQMSYPSPFQQQQLQQQRQMMFYPGSSSSMKRTPSSSSMTSGQMSSQPVFNPWSTIRLAQSQSLTASERELEMISARRGSEPPPPYGNQMTPQLRTVSHHDMMKPVNISRHHSFHENHNEFHLSEDKERSPSPMSRHHRDSFSSSSRNDTNHTGRQGKRINNRNSRDDEPSSDFWQCEWCTLINSYEKSICSVCCKTRKGTTNPATRSPAPPNSMDNERPDDSHMQVMSKPSLAFTSASPVPPPSTSPKKSNVVRSTLTFSRNEKDRSSAHPHVEKQIITVSDDDDVAGDPSSSSSSGEEVAVTHRESYNRQERKKNVNKSKTPLTSSNEEVYGSVPLQTLTIAPKSEFIEPKRKVSTGVGSSPPGSTLAVANQQQHTAAVSSPLHFGNVDQELRGGERGQELEGKGREKSSESPDTKSFKASHVIELKKMSTTETSTSSTSSSTTTQSFPDPFEPRLKSSKGTSPPPQSISTQTYDELPTSKMGSKSTSRSSIAGSSLVDPLGSSIGGRSVKEMSDKELRYTRKAQQQSKLKRSISTHLTSAATGDPWMEANEGRHLYRSSSRHSLASDTRSLPLSGPPSRETSPPSRGGGGRYYQDFRGFGPPSWDRFPSPADYFASIDDLVNRNRKDSVSTRLQETELAKLLKEAAESNFTPEDVQVALRMCGERNPIKWLQDNWGNMVETVQTLATKYGREKGEEKNEVGTISITEAREALRMNKGNVWLSVTDCVEQRRKKFLELQARGTFLREDILTALTANHGKLDSAYVELSKAQLKPFLMQMQIWGPPMGVDNESAPYPPSPSSSISGDKVIPDKSVATSSQSNMDSPEPKQEQDNSAPVHSEPEGNVSLTSQGLEQEISDTQPILLPATLPSEFEPMEEELQRLQTKRPSLDDEQFMDATEGVVGTDEFLKDRDTVTSASDLEESEAFVSDLLQNFQVGSDPSPLPPVPSTLEMGKQEPSSPFPEERRESVQSTMMTEERKDTGAPTQTIPGTSTEKTKLASPSLVPTVETTPLKSGTEVEQLNLPNSETIVQSKLHFSMEAVLELLDQQRIKLLKEQQELKNKEIELTQRMMRKEEGKVKTDNGQSSSSSNVDKLTLEGMLSSSRNFSDFDTFDLMTNLKPSLVASNRPSTVAATTTTSKNEYENQVKVQQQSINTLNTKMIGESRDGAIENKNKIFDRQHSTESGEGVGEGEVDISIYEEVDSGENFSVTEYLSTQQGRQNGGLSEESDEEEDVDGDETRDDDVDLSMDSSEESIETQSELSEGGSEEEDEIMETTYEKIELVEQKPMLSVDTSLKDGGVESLTVAETAGGNSQATAEMEKQKIEPVKEVKPEIRRLMESGLSDRHAERAVQLMDMKFTEEDSVYAAKECSSIYAALSYLQQDCLLCAGKFSATQMISMLRCTHWCCKSCATDYFTVQLRDYGILDTTCPFCKEPSNLLEDPDVAAEYFNHLDILLKNLLDTKHHEMFQRKLRDWTLAKTPNFKWCSKCSSGFITEPLQTRLVCPDCSAVTCAVCLEPWDRTHDHRDQSHVRLCDSDATKSIVDYLNENCIECPRCRLKFALARGGCMHLTCSQCKFEFCSGCSAQFRLSSKCHEGPFCEKLGLHAHHPRNCLFYLRDKEPAFLAQLLEENAIPYLSETGKEGQTDITDSEGQTVKKRVCRVSIQRETEVGLHDDICGNDAPPGFASVCQAHYIEYLGLLIWQNHLDPISILSNDDLETIIKRAKGHRKCPGRGYGTKDIDYRVKLLQVINDEIPL